MSLFKCNFYDCVTHEVNKLNQNFLTGSKINLWKYTDKFIEIKFD